MNKLKEYKKFAFKHKGEVFVSIETTEMKSGLPGIRKKVNGINRILLNGNLSEREKQLEFHRLLTGRGLRDIRTKKKVDFTGFHRKVNKPADPIKEQSLDDYSMEQVKIAMQQPINFKDAMGLSPILKEIKKSCSNDEFRALVHVYYLGIANGKREERARRKKVSAINNEFNKMEGLSL